MVDTFDVTVTSNDQYEIDAMYLGTWNHTEIPAYTYAANLAIGTTIPSATPLTGVYTNFYTSSIDIFDTHVTNWEAYLLSLPADMVQGTYTGPTIYIRATNA